VLFWNPCVQGLDLTDVRDHPYIRHGMKIWLGEMPGEIVFEDVPVQIQQRLNGMLRRVLS
jgi:hypothetical protein